MAVTPPKPTNSAQASTSELGDRVKSLRLPATVHRDIRGGNGRLPWVLVIMLATVLGYQTLFSRGSSSLVQQPVAAQPATGQSSPSPTSSNQRGPGQPSASTPSASTNTGATRSTSTNGPTNKSANDSGNPIVLESKGYVTPRRQVLISPQVSGRLIFLNVEEGRRVCKGDLLAEVDPTEYQADVSRGEASLQLARQQLLELENGFRPQEIMQAEAELREAEAQLPQLDADLARMRLLVERGVGSSADLDKATAAQRMNTQRVERLRYSLELMRAGPRAERIEVARATVQQAEAELTKSRWRLTNCKILAPISGTILKKNAEEGNLVNPIAFQGSFSICDVADLSDLEVDLNIQERDVSRVFPQQECEVRADAYPDRVYQGYVSRLMPIANRAKGAVPVRVKITIPSEEEGVYLKPDMSVLVTFLRGKSTPQSTTAAQVDR